MITINSVDKFNNTLELVGLSTDVKPTNKITFRGVDYSVSNGSTFFEMDTKKASLFDEENKIWIQQ